MTGRHELLKAFGEMVVAPRDRIFDDLTDFYAGASDDSIRRHVIESVRAGSIEPADIAEIVKHYVDRFIVDLMYEFQDARLNHGCEPAIADADGVYPLNAVSDGLAGDFLTEEGWLRSLSSHQKSRFDAD